MTWTGIWVAVGGTPNSRGFVADTSQQASDDAYPVFALMMNKMARRLHLLLEGL